MSRYLSHIRSVTIPAVPPSYCHIAKRGKGGWLPIRRPSSYVGALGRAPARRMETPGWSRRMGWDGRVSHRRPNKHKPSRIGSRRARSFIRLLTETGDCFIQATPSSLLLTETFFGLSVTTIINHLIVSPSYCHIAKRSTPDGCRGRPPSQYVQRSIRR